MKFLHVGCGPKRKDQTLPAFQSEDWQEVRFDIDESVAPDIIGTMTDMSAVGIYVVGALSMPQPDFLYINSREVIGKSGVSARPSI